MLGLRAGLRGRRGGGAAAPAPPSDRFTDSFARADGPLDGSTGWTRIGGASGDGQIQSGGVRSNVAGSPGTIYAAPAPALTNHYVEAVLLASNSSFCALRIADTANYVGMRFNGSNVQVLSFIAGSASTRYNAAGTLGGLYRLEASGSTFTLLLWNGSAFVSVWSLSITDPALQSGPNCGFVWRGGVGGQAAYDDFACGSL